MTSLAAHWRRSAEGASAPEPKTLALLMTGVVAIGLLARRGR